MPSTSPFAPSPNQQRLLAAIVFTDVAGFSRRVQSQESQTLKLLERDFTAMRAFTAMHSGRVIKSTGDGLLLFFTSAVQAVEWALTVQRHFADQANTLDADEVLRHRIGIHLGDVFVGAGDVMGDGVNIAARVQAEAPPGGICISQDVYGVVKNKLKLDVVRLEPRQLKNIREPVTMYRVLLEPPKPMLATDASGEEAEPVPAPQTATPLKKWAFVVIIVLALGAATFLLLEAHRQHQLTLAGSQATREALDAVNVPQETATTAVEPKQPTPAARFETAPATQRPSAAPEPPDFARLAAGPRSALSAEQEQQLLLAAEQAAAVLNEWAPKTLLRYTRETPLPAPPLRNPGFHSSVVYSDSLDYVVFVEGGASRKIQWPDLTPAARGAIIAALVRSSPTPPAREVVRGAEAFAFVHRLPEMAELLLRDRRAP